MAIHRALADAPWQDRAAGWLAAWTARLQRRALAWPAAALAAIVVLAISETSHRRSTQALERLEQRAAATQHIEGVVRGLLDVEASQRGYLLTGRRIYLAPASQAGAEVDAGLARLATFYPDDALSQARLDELRRQVGERRAVLDDAVRAFDEGRRDRLASLLAVDGPQSMESIRQLADRLADAEATQVALDRQAVFETLRTSRIGVNASAALGLLALLMVLRQTSAMETIQRRHAQALHDEQAGLEAEVARRTADLTELARHLQTAREDERSRLARDLHDELGAPLTAAKMEVLRLRRELAGAAPELRDRLEHLAASIDGGISLKRRIIDDLRPSSLANLGLRTALEIQAREFAERSGLQVHADVQPARLSDAAQITAYRLVQEALTNVAKYARATHVRVALQRVGADGDTPAVEGHGDAACWARVRVEDDGVGFDPAAPRRSAHGLMGMRYRVEAVGGSLSITSAPGRGTCIEATLPCEGLEDDA